MKPINILSFDHLPGVAEFLRECGINEAAISEIASHPKMTLQVCRQVIGSLDEQHSEPQYFVEQLRRQVKFFNAVVYIHQKNMESMRAKPNPALEEAKRREDEWEPSPVAEELREWRAAQQAVVDEERRVEEEERQDRREARQERRGVGCEGCAGVSIHHSRACGMVWNEELGEYTRGYVAV